VSHSCPLVGRTVRDGHFRSGYAAAVSVWVRNGERIRQRIGAVVLCPGNSPLVQANPRLAGVILLGLVLVVATGHQSTLEAATHTAGLMIATRCLPVSEARTASTGRCL